MTTAAPPFSIEVVIPTYNMADQLRACLAGLVPQLAPGDRITVVDDGSTDGTPAVVAELGVDYLRTSGRTGPYQARHLAAARSSADGLLFVDTRCRALPGLLAAHRALLATDGVALSCTDVTVEVSAGLASRIAGVHDWFNVAGKIGVPGQPDFYPTANLGVLRSAYLAVGGFRRMRSGGDADLCWRVQQAGLGGFGVDSRVLMTWCPRQKLRQLAEQSYRYGQSWAYLEQVYPKRPTSLPVAVPPHPAPRPVAGSSARTGAKLSYLVLRAGYQRQRRRGSGPPPVPYAEIESVGIELDPADLSPAGPVSEEPMSSQSGPKAKAPSKAPSKAWQNLHADLARYRQDDWLRGKPWWISERTIWAVAAFRLGQRMLEIENPLVRRLLATPYGMFLALIHSLTQIEIWPNTEIGPGLRIHHGGNVVINAATVIGANCQLRQGVTLGVVRAGDSGCPVIGDDVEFGTYAQVFGPITIGDGAKIGSMSVVLADVPAGATAVGAPARIIGAKTR